MSKIPLAVRFWQKVRKSDGCWEWTASTYKTGYGAVAAPVGKRMLKAHRVSWELHFGKIPADKWVLHHCDNRLCVRPDHLYLGTVVENTRDMMERGRHNSTTDVALATLMARTHCPKGHEYTEANVYWRGAARVCKKCHNARIARYKGRKEMKEKVNAMEAML